MTNKKVMVSETMLINVFKLLCELDSINYNSEVKNAVNDELRAKLDKIQQRQEYTNRLRLKNENKNTKY